MFLLFFSLPFAINSANLPAESKTTTVERTLIPPAVYSADIAASGNTTTAERSLVPPAPEVTVTEEDSSDSDTATTKNTIPPIPSLEDWEDNMKTYGAKYLTQAQFMDENLVWYYDGTKVFYQIAEYTRNKTWLAGAKNVLNWYRDQYVIKNNGMLPGWRLFPHGLLMDFRATGDIKSKDAVVMLAKNGAFAGSRGASFKLNDVGLSREIAYNINCYEVARELGEPGFSGRDPFIDVALYHLQQWTGWLKNNPDGKKYPWPDKVNGDCFKPFMAGLTCEALIRVCENNGVDSGKKQQIFSAIKEFAPMMFKAAWIKGRRTFWYESSKRVPAADLSLLVCPLYGWLWHYTGDKSFLEMGDQLFENGVQGAYLDGGKQFSQNYRWSFDYVKWRKEPPLSAGGPASALNSEANTTLISVIGKKPGMKPKLVRSMLAKGLKKDDIVLCYCASKYSKLKMPELISARLKASTNYEFLNKVLNLGRDEIKAVNEEENVIKKELNGTKP